MFSSSKHGDAQNQCSQRMFLLNVYARVRADCCRTMDKRPTENWKGHFTTMAIAGQIFSSIAQKREENSNESFCTINFRFFRCFFTFFFSFSRPYNLDALHIVQAVDNGRLASLFVVTLLCLCLSSTSYCLPSTRLEQSKQIIVIIIPIRLNDIRALRRVTIEQIKIMEEKNKITFWSKTTHFDFILCFVVLVLLTFGWCSCAQILHCISDEIFVEITFKIRQRDFIVYIDAPIIVSEYKKHELFLSFKLLFQQILVSFLQTHEIRIVSNSFFRLVFWWVSLM